MIPSRPQPQQPLRQQPPNQRPSRWPPLIILVPSVVVSRVGTVLPLVYLVLRSLEAGEGVWSFVLRPRTLGVVWRSLALAFCVTTASLALALAHRLAHLAHHLSAAASLWFVLSVLPLVIPSFVGAFALVSAFAPGGLITGWLEGWLPFDVPSPYGFWGRVCRAYALSTTPICF